jgi:Ran GTPase-activating protein (RanGAP) involved in mRNA processing and transport
MTEFGTTVPGLQLETLDLGENMLGVTGADHVARAACLRELKVLKLDRCEIPQADAVRLMEEAPFIDTLRSLDVGSNHFGPAGLRALLERAPELLHTLRMRDNDLLDKGAQLLATSPASDVLLELDLSQNVLGAAAAASLGAAPHLRNLLILHLANNPLLAEAASALATSTLGKRLSVLELPSPPPPPTAVYDDEDPIPF